MNDPAKANFGSNLQPRVGVSKVLLLARTVRCWLIQADRRATVDCRADESVLADGTRLDGWKAIADHLGHSVRTVQRWERTERMPIRRHTHLRQASAWAYRSELDEWLGRRSANSSGLISGPSNHEDQRWDSPQSQSENSRGGILGRRRELLVVLILVLFGSLVTIGSNRRSVGGATAWDTQQGVAYGAHARGESSYNDRKFQDAVKHAKSALSDDPRSAVSWVLLAKSYGRLASVGLDPAPVQQLATEAAQRAVELAPRVGDAYVAMALAARARRDVSSWRTNARRATELDTRSAEGYALLADSYSAHIHFACARDQNPELAEFYYRWALEIEPSLTTALFNRAQNLAYLGRYEECATLLSPLIDATGNLSAIANRARCRLMQGNTAAAARDVESLLSNSQVPRRAQLLHQGWLQLKQGNTEQGVRDLEELATRYVSVQAELSVSQAYADVADASRTAEHLNRAFRMDAECAKMTAAAPSFRAVRRAPEVIAVLGSYGIR